MMTKKQIGNLPLGTILFEQPDLFYNYWVKGEIVGYDDARDGYVTKILETNDPESIAENGFVAFKYLEDGLKSEFIQILDQKE